MSWDDIVYLIMLIISIGVGPLLRRIEDSHGQQIASAATGFCIVFLVSGSLIIHPIILVIANCGIVFLLNKRICHTVSFIFCFGYLAFIRLSEHFGLPPIPPYLNAVQMILTLKMVGLAFEVHDTSCRQADPKLKGSLEDKFKSINPSVLDIACYAFCHAGVLTGPYYKFRTYWDSFHGPYSKYVNFMPHFINCIKFVPMYAVLYLIFSYFYPVEYAESEEIFSRSFWYRVWYITPLFISFRMRIYTGFTLSECQCITAGLGVYPVECKSKPGQGPMELQPLQDLSEDTYQLSQIQYEYETIHNLNVYNSEFVPTIREGMKNWNMTVQYWLAVFVYKRVPWKNLRVTITMFMSAFWHGIYPGYYLCLLSVPFQLMAEDVMAKAFRRNATEEGQKIYDRICWFFKMHAFSYMGVGFYLLEIKPTLSYWMSIYFLGHVLMGVFYAFGLTVLAIRRKSHKTAAPVHETGGEKKLN